MEAKIYRKTEIVLHSAIKYDNPFLEVRIDAVFTHENGKTISLPGFWNGEDEWRVRFIPTLTGVWKYSVVCSDADNSSLASQGEIYVSDSERRNEIERHGYVRLEDGKRYFVYDDGKPFFWLGDTHWQMPDYERLDECNYPGCSCHNQFTHLLDDRVKKGFTVYQTYFDSAESDGGGNKRRYNWWSEKYTLINPSAFNDSMDIMMEEFARRGITVAMGFGVHTSSISRFGSDPVPVLAFVRYCVARYACYPVVWITAQEITDERYNTFEIWKKAAALVSELDGYHHPNSAHMYPMRPADSRAQSLDSCEWHEYWMLQGGHGGRGNLQPRAFYEDYRKLPSAKPYIEGECMYEDIFCGAFNGYNAPRIAAWQAMMSGAAGFTYGVTGIWAMGWDQREDKGWLSYSPEPWYIGMDKPGSREVGYMRKFFEYIGWEKLEPDFAGEFGSGEHEEDAHIGRETVVRYSFTTGSEMGEVRNLIPGAEYKARFFDPITGKFILLDDIVSADGNAALPSKPSPRDWVILLTTEDFGECETETYPQVRDACAYGKAVVPISVKASGEEEENPAANMLDGKDDTLWKPFAAYVSDTLTADFGECTEISSAFITFGNCGERAFDIRTEISSDGTDWRIADERVNGGVHIDEEKNTFSVGIGEECRYVRFIISPDVNEEKLSVVSIGFTA